MTLIDKACFERGCACYDSRDKGECVEITEKREWVGLTDEEILSEAKRFALGLSFPFNGITTPEMFARTIEAKLKEKNS